MLKHCFTSQPQAELPSGNRQQRAASARHAQTAVKIHSAQAPHHVQLATQLDDGTAVSNKQAGTSAAATATAAAAAALSNTDCLGKMCNHSECLKTL
mmetsp:Transcript_38118/g.73205  ORF Transcript_38118/g.73205 Transcript_38118/m.73205 type:complete len:97 (-) Transcript_38118:37-327(-)